MHGHTNIRFSPVIPPMLHTHSPIKDATNQILRDWQHSRCRVVAWLRTWQPRNGGEIPDMCKSSSAERPNRLWSQPGPFLKSPAALSGKQNSRSLNLTTHLYLEKGKAIPLQAWTGSEGPRRLRLLNFKTAHEGGKVVSPTHRPPLPSTKYSWYSFLLEVESTPGPQCGRKDYVNEKFQWHHRESNPRPSRLVAQCINQLRHRVPHLYLALSFKMSEVVPLFLHMLTPRAVGKTSYFFVTHKQRRTSRVRTPLLQAQNLLRRHGASVPSGTRLSTMRIPHWANREADLPVSTRH